MALLWAGLIGAGLPPGSLLVVHLAGYVVGAVLLGLSVNGRAGLVFSLLLLWPPFLALFGHLWTDVGMAAALMLAAGWIAWTNAMGRSRLAWLAVIPLTYAICVRHNALFAAPPFFYLLVHHRQNLSIRAKAAIAVSLTAAAFGVAVTLSKLSVARSVPAWSSTAIWDLSAASVASGRLLLPKGMHGPTLTTDELRPLLNPHASLNLLTGTKSGINAGVVEPLPVEVERELLVRWLQLPFTHGSAWFNHRAAIARSLFGTQQPDKVFIEPYVHQFRDNPTIHANTSRMNAALRELLGGMRETLWCAPAVYLGLSLVAVGLALRRQFPGDRALVVCLSASAWLFALPLAVVLPAADWRYTLWAMLGSVLALLLAVAGTPVRRATV